MCRAAFVFGVLIALVIPGPAREQVSADGLLQLNLLQTPSERFSGDTPSRDFLVRLPSHVDFGPGSELAVSLTGDPPLLALISYIQVVINGRSVTNHSLDGKNPAEAKEFGLGLKTQVPTRALQGGWNRIRLQFVPRSTAEGNRDVLTNCQWAITARGTHLRVAYQRTALFPELRRFPESIAEEKLLKSQAGSPTLAVLVPARLRDTHLRACAVIGARLGQLGFLADEDCRLAPIENWKIEIPVCSGVMVGCREELSQVDLPANFTDQLARLKPGEGFLAEFITGTFPEQRRWVVASGADDAGLEKAILTLGHTYALISAPPNPAVLTSEPVLDEASWSQEQSKTAGPGTVSGAEQANPKTATLAQLQSLLVRDPYLNRTAFLVPKSASLQETKVMFDLAMDLGKQLPHSPVLWPEACSFSRVASVPAERLKNRSALLLGSVAEWKNASPKTHWPLEVPAADTGTVRIQGRKHKLSTFEPSLAFIYLLPSPWSEQELLLTAGGWLDVPGSPTRKLFREAGPAGKLFGNLCATDAAGRTAAYDTRRPSVKSFVEIVARNIPAGLTVAETNEQLEKHHRDTQQSSKTNRIISYAAGGWLIFLVASRILLMWEREWSRKKSMRAEQLVSGT